MSADGSMDEVAGNSASRTGTKTKKPTEGLAFCFTADLLLTAFTLSLVGRAGFEPATNGLKVRCSTS
jgi:hypothetical protein